jgi:hydroxymethylbilane synthase
MVETAVRARWPGLEVETRIIRTSGDETSGARAAAGSAGRKGLFTAEIERALINGNIDAAVHSAKDLPSTLGAGTEIVSALPRAEVEDVLVSVNGYDLESLPRDGLVATGSVRRRHQLRWQRPDLGVVDLRGNVPTRLRKLGREQWSGAIFARAGLERLGMQIRSGPTEFEGSRFSMSALPLDIFVPAGGQGVIAIQIRANDEDNGRLLEPINDSGTQLCLRAEREFLRLLQGDCNQPVGVLAIVNGNVMKMRGQLFHPNKTSPEEGMVEGNSTNPEGLAAELLGQINGQ